MLSDNAVLLSYAVAAREAGITHRVRLVPAVPFESWAKARGYADLERETDVVEVLCGAMFNHTRHSRGKLRAPIERIARTRAARERYVAEVNAGTIPSVERRVLLDLTRASDRAYLRAQLRRKARVIECGRGELAHEQAQ